MMKAERLRQNVAAMGHNPGLSEMKDAYDLLSSANGRREKIAEALTKEAEDSRAGQPSSPHLEGNAGRPQDAAQPLRVSVHAQARVLTESGGESFFAKMTKTTPWGIRME
ncbi:MAG: hypothetical protein P4L36_07675 [Holophaga sp.]|nr:hypothetical protein [Holophaga sp.]